MWINFNWIWVLYLGVVALGDIKTKSISRGSLLCGVILLGLFIYKENPLKSQLIMGAILGVVFLLISILSKEALGLGDSIVISYISIWLGANIAMYILLFSFLLVGIIAGLINIRSGISAKVSRVVNLENDVEVNFIEEEYLWWQREVPYLPFLAISCLLYVIISYGK